MKPKQSPQERLKRLHIDHMRKRIRVRRRFSVEYVGGLKLKYTCRTCGRSTVKDYSFEATGHRYSEAAFKRLAAYQDQGGGAGDVCDYCTRAEQDRQHPYPKNQ